LGPQAIENSKRKIERHNRSLISFEKCIIDDFVVAELALPFWKCNIDGLVVAELVVAKRLDDLATPIKALCRRAGIEKIFDIFFPYNGESRRRQDRTILNFYLLAKKR
jgi:hypothetical protein